MRKKLLATLLCACMVLGMLPAAAFAADFSDTKDHWAESAIQRWADYGIVGGYEDGTFGANRDLTRAEMCQIICNLLGLTPSTSGEFTDVRAGDWYAGPVAACRKAGIISGYGDGRFGPNDKLTREQSMTILCNALGVKPAADTSSLNKFPDTQSVSDWAKPYVAAMVDAGIVGGTDKGIEGSTDINRASVMAILDTSVGSYINKSGSYDLSEVPAGKITLVAAGDVTLTGETAGDVLVAEGSKEGGVTLKDAKVEGTVTVGGADTSVKLDGKTEVETVAVAPTAASAEVSVGKDAKADTVETEAASSKVAVEGTVGTLTVGEQATSAETTVGKDAEVTNLETKAANTTTTVAGKVENVTVAETAGNATVTAEKGAKIDNVTTNAANTTVGGEKNTIGNVTAGANATGTQVDASGAKVKNESSEPVTNNKNETVAASGSTGTSNTTPGTSTGGSSGGGGGGGGGSSASSADVIAAPLYDQRQTNSAAAGTYIEASKLAQNYTVSGTAAGNDDNGKPIYNVTISAKHVMKHKNADSPASENYWVGFGIPKADTSKMYTYKYNTNGSDTYTNEIEDAKNRVVQRGGKDYNTIYFDKSDHDKTYYIQQIDGDDVVATYKVTFNVTRAPVVENLKLSVVKNLGDVRALNLPEDSFNALIIESERDEEDTFAAADMPWLVAVYDRNVIGDHTFTVTQDGTSLTQATPSGAQSKTTVGAQRVQSWSMNPKDNSNGKLWNAKPVAGGEYGTFAVTITADGESVTATKEYLEPGATYHTVTFKDIISDAVLQTAKVKEGGTFTPNNAPAKTGYTVNVSKPWVASDKTTQWTPGTTTVTENTTVYANYEANHYSVTYDANSGTGTAPTNSNGITYDAPFTVSTNVDSSDNPILTRDGYTFDSWNTKADGTGTKFTAGQKVTKWTAIDDAAGAAGSQTITLYAQWKAIEYTVKFGDITETYTVEGKITADGTVDETVTQVKAPVIPGIDPTFKSTETTPAEFSTFNCSDLHTKTTDQLTYTAEYEVIGIPTEDQSYANGAIKAGEIKVTGNSNTGYIVNVKLVNVDGKTLNPGFGKYTIKDDGSVDNGWKGVQGYMDNYGKVKALLDEQKVTNYTWITLAFDAASAFGFDDQYYVIEGTFDDQGHCLNNSSPMLEYYSQTLYGDKSAGTYVTGQTVASKITAATSNITGIKANEKFTLAIKHAVSDETPIAMFTVDPSALKYTAPATPAAPSGGGTDTNTP